MGLTIHFLNSSRKMEKAQVGCLPLNKRATAKNLKKTIKKILDIFSIQVDKIKLFVTDTDIVGSSRHIVCFVHVFSHILGDVYANLEEFKVIATKVKSISTFIRRSIPTSRRLKQPPIKNGKTEGTALTLKQ